MQAPKAALRTDPELWQKIVARVKHGDIGGPAGTWNARKAQLCVKLYKDAGGKYKGPKSPKNALVIWTDEDWGYIDNKPGNRYLPKEVRDKLTPEQKRAENRAKKIATEHKKQYASYASTDVAKKVMTTKPKMRNSRKSRKSRKSRSRKSHK